MIEKIVYDYLKQELSPIPVKMEIPADPPEEYVIIQKTAGGEDNKLEYSTISIQGISALSLLRAAEINENIKTAMRTITDDTEIMKCKLNSDYNFTNTASKVYRYQAVFNLVH